MRDAVRAAGVRHQVGLVLRLSPIVTVLKDLTSDPGLGRLMTVIFRDDQTFPILGHYRSTWRGDFTMTGGGTLIEHSIHDLDILSWLCGEVESLRAETRNFAGHDGVEDIANVSLSFASGATGQLASVWHGIENRNTHRLLELFFERGYFAAEEDFLGPIRFDTYASRGKAEMSADQVRSRYLELIGMPDDDTYRDALRRFSFEDLFFLRAIAEDRDPFPGFDVALRAHELVDAVYRSAADGGAVVRPATS
jgi:predicted dehydrogenase